MVKRRKWTQYEILSLLHHYDFRCAHCRSLVPPEVEIDHIVPISCNHWNAYDERTAYRLANHISNLQPLCPNCHAKKSRQEQATLLFISKKYQKEVYCPRCRQTSSKYFVHSCLDGV